MNTNTKLHGLVVATHTPFNANGSLNLAVVEKQAAYYQSKNIATAFIGGSTGESHSLSLEERRQLAQRWFEVTRGSSLKVVVHVGANCLSDACSLATQAQQLGAIAISALVPSYFKPRNLAALVDCCAEIAAAAPATPFYFYDIPSMTGVNFSMAEFLTQARDRIPNLNGIKFTNYDLMGYQLCLRVDGGRFDIPWGVDEFLLAALVMGAKGAVGSTYNFAAPVYQRLIKAFEAGDLVRAREEQFRSVQLVQLLAGYGYMGAAKATMGLLGVEVGPARLPNGNLTADQVKELRQRLEALGFFDWIKG